MEVLFTVTEQDFIALQRYHLTHRRRWLWVAVVVLFLVLMVLPPVTFGVHGPEEFISFVVVPVLFLGGGFGVLVLLTGLATAASGRWLARRNPALLGQERIVLAPDAITSISESITLKTNWNAVQETGVTKNHVFLFFTSMAAYVIPKSPFLTDEGFAEFVEAAKAYRDAAKMIR